MSRRAVRTVDIAGRQRVAMTIATLSEVAGLGVAWGIIVQETCPVCQRSLHGGSAMSQQNRLGQRLNVPEVQNSALQDEAFILWGISGPTATLSQPMQPMQPMSLWSWQSAAVLSVERETAVWLAWWIYVHADIHPKQHVRAAVCSPRVTGHSDE